MIPGEITSTVPICVLYFVTTACKIKEQTGEVQRNIENIITKKIFQCRNAPNWK